ncbi:hypothetical protein RDI58_023720 [Solanum bulbocastanum]|uniref:Uncharacterized protein n=1 Tax=Solanum bulbocastanum TaxID=147425 RepID=A0AAN8SW98_SOLBU
MGEILNIQTNDVESMIAVEHIHSDYLLETRFDSSTKQNPNTVSSKQNHAQFYNSKHEAL